MIYNYNEIKMVHFEPTQKCQASCPMCDRNKNGGDVNQYLTNRDVSFEEFKKIFSVNFLKQLKSFMICGNHGDPILCPDLIDMCKYIRESNPDIQLYLITNGGARSPDWWIELAQWVSYVNFSIDGLEDTNHFYRQGVNWQRLEENMDAFISAGGVADWTFLVFGYNEHQVEDAEQFARLMGVRRFIVKKSGRYVNSATLTNKDDHEVFNRKNDFNHLLTKPKDEKYKNKATETDYNRIVEKFGSLENYIEIADIQPKCADKKEIYVSAEGLVFPCCWLAGQIYKWWRPKEDGDVYQLLQTTGGLQSINAIKFSLQKIIEGEFFHEIQNSWKIKGCSNGRIQTCGLKCNSGFDPFSAQWK